MIPGSPAWTCRSIAADTRRAALAGLAVFADQNTKQHWSLGPMPASFTADKQNRIREGCYELLFVMAGAVDRPEEGLGYLEQAVKLCPPTMAYHLRRAEILSKAGDSVAARESAARQRPRCRRPRRSITSCSGKNDTNAMTSCAASRHFDSALYLQADHFWARCMSGLCSLRDQPPQPTVAKVSLSGCIASEPTFAWLYVLRGFASYQIAGELLRNRPSTEASLRARRRELPFPGRPGGLSARAMTLLEQKPDDVLRWVALVNRGAALCLARRLGKGRGRLRGGNPVGRTSFRSARRAGAGRAEEKRKRMKPTTGSARPSPCGPIRLDCTGVGPKQTSRART